MNLERQKIKRYKVVKKTTRYSCVIPGYNTFSVRYLPETEVFALPQTLGIMCFTQLTYAERFFYSHWHYQNNCIIIPVIPIGIGKFPYELGIPSMLHQFYCTIPHVKDEATSNMRIPEGTICYPGVYVLE
jgi:hypothetical protein